MFPSVLVCVNKAAHGSIMNPQVHHKPGTDIIMRKMAESQNISLSDWSGAHDF